jgi:hypothetical protein
MPVIPVLCRLRQDDLKFKASLGYVDRTCLKKKRKNWVLVTHSCNPSYSGDQEVRSGGFRFEASPGK